MNDRPPAMKDLPPEVSFLISCTSDPNEQQAILQAYYTLCGGTPDSIAVQAGVFASALLRANLEIQRRIADDLEGTKRSAAELKEALGAIQRAQRRNLLVIAVLAFFASGLGAAVVLWAARQT